MKSDTGARRYGDLMKHRGFRLLWLSGVVNALGSAVTAIALPLYIYDLTASPVALGVGFFLETLPWVLIGPVLGVWSDRGDRRRLILGSTLGQAVLIGLAPLTTAVGFLYLLCVLSAALFVLSTPARSAVVPEVLGADLFPQGVALSQLTQQILQVAGPFFGGVVVAAATPRLAFFVDAVSFVAAAILFALVPIPDAARFPERTDEDLVGQLNAGLRCIWTRAPLRLALLVSAPSMLTLGAALTLTPAFVRTDLGLGANGLGLLQGLFSVGVVAAGFGAVELRRRYAVAPLLGFGAALFGLAFVPLLTPTTLAVSALLWLCSGGGRGIVSTLSQVAFALDTPVEVRGRVFALANALTMAARMTGSLIAGALAQAIGIRGALALSGVLGGLAALAVVIRSRQTV